MEGDVSTTAGRSARRSAFRRVGKALSGRHGHPRPSRNLQPQSSTALLTHYSAPAGVSTRQPSDTSPALSPRARVEV